MLLTAATEALNTGTPGLRGDSSPSPPDRFTVPSTSHQKERIRQHRFARKVQQNTEVILEVRIARKKNCVAKHLDGTECPERFSHRTAYLLFICKVSGTERNKN